MNRGEVFRIKGPRKPRGHEQAGPRFGVVLQADDFARLSTVIIAPTSRSAAPSTFRPEIEVAGEQTRVLIEHLQAVDPTRLGAIVGSLSRRELEDVDSALRTVLGLGA